MDNNISYIDGIYISMYYVYNNDNLKFKLISNIFNFIVLTIKNIIQD